MSAKRATMLLWFPYEAPHDWVKKGNSPITEANKPASLITF
jgi:hypothetical protein